MRTGPGYRDVVGAALSELELTGLADADAAALLDRAAPDLAPAVRDRIHAESRGNPLALLELPVAHRVAAHLGGTGSEPALLPMTERLERAFAERVTTLPAPAAAALLVAALLTTDALAEILAATSVLVGAPCGVDAVEPAVAAGLITTSSASLRFRHPLVRSAVAQTAPLPRRQQAHAALAAVLTADPYRSTWHLAMAVVGPDDNVADRLEEAVGATPSDVGRHPRRCAASNAPPSSRVTAPVAGAGSSSPPSTPVGSATRPRWRGCSTLRSPPPTTTSTTSSARGSRGCTSSPAAVRR